MTTARSKAWHKPILFGLCALLGGLLAAVPGEVWDRYAAPPAVAPPPPPPQIDVVFVLDVTGSMQPAIDGVRDGINAFVGELDKRQLDARVALVAFRDRHPKDKGGDDEDPVALDFGDGSFTKDVAAFKAKVATLKAERGGDPEESSLDALAFASRLAFRTGATRVLMLITDERPKLPDKEIPSVDAAARLLRERNIDQLHLVVPEFVLSDRGEFFKDKAGNTIPVLAVYRPLQSVAPGEWFPLRLGKAEGPGFDKVLPKVGEAIAERSVKGLQGRQEVAEKDAWRLALAIAGWTGLVGLGVALAIKAGQNGYLRRPLLALDVLAAAGIGLAAGLLAGLAGQLVFQLTAAQGQEALARVVGWALLGLLLGLGTSLGVPNLGWLRGSLGGLLGGLVGVGIFLGLAGTGELPSRLGGAAGLGLCVGLMIGVAEVAFRQAWLEVSYGPREIRTVMLGAEGVSIGSKPGCTILARGAAPVALRYRLTGGKVTCEDATTGKTSEVQPGDRRHVGAVTVVVGAAAQSAASPAAGQAGARMPLDPWSAGATVLTGQPTGFVLRMSYGSVLVLVEGQSLTTADLPGLTPLQAGVVADISRHPQDPAVIGLRNLARQKWKVQLPDGTSREVEPQRSVRLAAGTRITFIGYSAEVQQ